jgi:hypothetical protein
MTMKPASVLLHSFACSIVSAIAPSLAAPAIADGADVVSLFNGKDFAGWRQPAGEWFAVGAVKLDPTDSKRFVAEPGAGVMVNGTKGRTVNLLTEGEFGDVEAHIEFCLPKGSNSGIYFMGRYEIQVYDSHGKATDKYPGIECGGIYPRWDAAEKRNYDGHSPHVNASKPPGEWQRFDVVFRAPRFDASGRKVENAKFVKVVHNGQVVHENIEMTGHTRAAAFNDEKPAGPLMFQGDHGPIAYRNLRIKQLNRE